MTTYRADGVERDGLDVSHERIGQGVTRDGSDRFTVTGVSARQRCVTVALHGELDTATALILFGQLAFFCVGDPWMMVADMTDVTLIDADGVGCACRRTPGTPTAFLPSDPHGPIGHSTPDPRTRRFLEPVER